MQTAARIVASAVAIGFALTGAVGTTTATAAAKPVIYSVSKEYVPKGKKGAIILPWVSCAAGSSSNRATIRKVGSSKTVSASWGYGLEYVRVTAGTYRVSIRSTCADGATATRTATVKVRKEKDGNTVTSAEFKRIRKGMTLGRVKKIVGTKGIGNSANRYLDRRGSFGWAQIWLVKGRVGGKLWVAELGDNGVR